MPRNQNENQNNGDNSENAIVVDTDNEAEENEEQLQINNNKIPKNEENDNEENQNNNGNNEEKDESNDNEDEEEEEDDNGNQNENENENENKNENKSKNNLNKGQKSKDGAKRRKKKTDNQYRVYIYKILQQVHPKLGITKTAMDIVNCFIQDYFEKICNESMKLNQFHKSNTISVREIETACKLLLPGELKKHALLEGDQAVKKFSENKNQLMERRKELRGGKPGVFRGKRKSKAKN